MEFIIGAEVKIKKIVFEEDTPLDEAQKTRLKNQIGEIGKITEISDFDDYKYRIDFGKRFEFTHFKEEELELV